MIQTIPDEHNRQLLVLCVTASYDYTGAHSPDETRWRAQVSDHASPLAGLCAVADTLLAARDALAALAWAAVVAGELGEFGINAHDIAGIHVALTSCARYDADALMAAIGGAA